MEPIEQLTEVQQQILEGHLLGDGCLSIKKQYNFSNASFSIYKKIEDQEYLLWTVKHFENFVYETGVSEINHLDKRFNKIYSGVQFSSRSLPVFTNYYDKWYPHGIKIVPEDL